MIAAFFRGKVTRASNDEGLLGKASQLNATIQQGVSVEILRERKRRGWGLPALTMNKQTLEEIAIERVT